MRVSATIRSWLRSVLHWQLNHIWCSPYTYVIHLWGWQNSYTGRQRSSRGIQLDLSLIVNRSSKETFSTVVSGDAVAAFLFNSHVISYFLSYEFQPRTTMKSRHSSVTIPIVLCEIYSMIQSSLIEWQMKDTEYNENIQLLSKSEKSQWKTHSIELGSSFLTSQSKRLSFDFLCCQFYCTRCMPGWHMLLISSLTVLLLS
jgi:hypothetical protein